MGMRQKNKTKATTRQKARAVDKPFEIEDEYEDVAEEEISEMNEEAEDLENSPVDVEDEDVPSEQMESDARWTSPAFDEVTVAKSKAVAAFLEVQNGIRAVPLKWKRERSPNENISVVEEIIKRINDENFSSFDDMVGAFKSHEFENESLFRKVVTNNYAILEPYGRIVRLNFLTSSGRHPEEIKVDRLKRDVKEIFEDGYSKKGEVAEILVEKYGYKKSIQRSKVFKSVYDEVKKIEKE